jgi:hypothetical protein
VIRVANKPDIVPDVPKAFFLQNAYYVICTLLNFQWGRDALNWAETLQYNWKVCRLPSGLNFPSAGFVV